MLSKRQVYSTIRLPRFLKWLCCQKEPPIVWVCFTFVVPFPVLRIWAMLKFKLSFISSIYLFNFVYTLNFEEDQIVEFRVVQMNPCMHALSEKQIVYWRAVGEILSTLIALLFEFIT